MSRKLLIKYTDGTGVTVTVPDNIMVKDISLLGDKGQKSTQLYIYLPIPKKPPVNANTRENIYSGLWFTDKNIFLEVISLNECYIIDVDGYRVCKTSIDDTGGSTLAGNIYTKRRGAEDVNVKKSIFTWPTLKGIERPKSKAGD